MADYLEFAGAGVGVLEGVNALLLASAGEGTAAAATAATTGSVLVAGGAILALAAAGWMLYRAGKEGQRQTEARNALRGYDDATEQYADVSGASAKLGRLLGQYNDLEAPGVSAFDDVLREKLTDAMWDVLDELLWAMREVCSAMSRAGAEVEDAFGYGWAPKLDQVGTWFTPFEVIRRSAEMTAMLQAFAWSLDDASVAMRVKVGDLQPSDEDGQGGEWHEWNSRQRDRMPTAKALDISVRGRDYVEGLHEEGRQHREGSPGSARPKNRYGAS